MKIHVLLDHGIDNQGCIIRIGTVHGYFQDIILLAHRGLQRALQKFLRILHILERTQLADTWILDHSRDNRGRCNQLGLRVQIVLGAGHDPLFQVPDDPGAALLHIDAASTRINGRGLGQVNESRHERKECAPNDDPAVSPHHLKQAFRHHARTVPGIDRLYRPQLVVSVWYHKFPNFKDAIPL